MPGFARFVAALLLVVPMLCFGVAQPAQSRPVDAEQPLIAVLNQFLAQVNDPATHEKFWADDLVYVSSAGKLRSKPELLKSVRAEAGQPLSTAMSFAAEDVLVRDYGQTAVINFTLLEREGPPRGPRNQGAVRRYRNCAVFRRTASGWQAVSWQSTAVPEPPPAGE